MAIFSLSEAMAPIATINFEPGMNIFLFPERLKDDDLIGTTIYWNYSTQSLSVWSQ